ncbi:MAG: glycerophosphoryl diester phosphodiesterase membrane domain-containing protein [Actinomycetales bacterium]|nr:glycerophosphoryl diester phosphodiesterase membrane domain-containing protein [Actinomycetales bacterium]
MSGFGPAPGAPEEPARPRRAAYLPPARVATGATPGAGRLGAYGHRYSLTRASKPGIIPLAPLGVADLLDGAAKHVRRNPGPVLGAASIVNAVCALPVVVLVTLAFTGSWLRATRVATVVDEWAVAPLLGLGGTAYAMLVLTGVLSYAVAEAALGRRRSLSEISSMIRPRVWALLGSQAIVVAVAVLPWALLVGTLALLAEQSVPLVLALATVLGLLAVVIDLVVVPRLLFAGPAVVLERLGVGRALARAWNLSRRRFGAISGVFLLSLSIAVLVFWTLELPQWLIYNLLVDLLEVPATSRDAAGTFAFTLANLGAAILVTPFLASVVVLQYLDCRMRAEGLDLVMRRAAAADAEAAG